jgi:hypothetical protein
MNIPVWWRGGLVAIAIVVAVVIAHGGAINGEFHYDDKVTITENLAIRQWQPWFYFTSPFAASSEPGAEGYRPLTVTSFALNYALGGLDPTGYLVGNLLLHLAASWLVFVVGRRLLFDDRWAALAALVYAVHPVNSEAVNYAVARSSLLAVCGTLIACWAFVRREAGGGRVWTVIGTVAFLCALFSKESAVALLVPLGTYHLLISDDRSGGPRRVRHGGAEVSLRSGRTRPHSEDTSSHGGPWPAPDWSKSGARRSIRLGRYLRSSAARWGCWSGLTR